MKQKQRKKISAYSRATRVAQSTIGPVTTPDVWDLGFIDDNASAPPAVKDAGNVVVVAEETSWADGEEARLTHDPDPDQREDQDKVGPQADFRSWLDIDDATTPEVDDVDPVDGELFCPRLRLIPLPR